MFGNGTTIVTAPLTFTNRTLRVLAGARQHITGVGTLMLTAGALQLAPGAEVTFSNPTSFTVCACPGPLFWHWTLMQHRAESFGGLVVQVNALLNHNSLLLFKQSYEV